MILLDTCVLYWLASDHAKLSVPARDALRVPKRLRHLGL
jgi:PIN domain nuclease of toxin-antitoxin system